jgi:hypothetical protein
MPKKYLPFSNHTSPQIFGRLSLLASSKIGTSGTNLNLEFRIFLAGLGRLSNRGHAAFGRGELAESLPIIDINTSESRTYSDRQIRKKIKVLVIAGLLSPESNARCLVYPVEIISLKTSRGSDLCPEHGTHRSWSNGANDWVDDYPPAVSLSSDLAEVRDDIQELNGPFEEFENHFMGTFSS